MSDYEARLAAEQKRFDAEINVHDLPDIFHYWSNKYLRPMLNGMGYDCIEDFFAQEAAKVATPAKPLAVLGLGSGDCALELDVAGRLSDMGVAGSRFTCLDLSPDALARAAASADERGCVGFDFRIHDFNTGVPQGPWDVVIANQSLHHVVQLEILFDAVKREMAPGGVFLVSDMIGRNGHMRWPEAAELVNAIWPWLPASYRYNRQLQRMEETFQDWDCAQEGFEGVRAQDVLPLLLERFHPETFLAWGNIIDVFIDRGFGHGFHRKSEWDLHFIDRVHALDEAAITEGRISPTHLLASFRKQQVGRCTHLPGMPPHSAVRGGPVPPVRPSARASLGYRLRRKLGL